MRAYEAGRGDGIVICLFGSNLIAFDLDDCRNATTGEIEPAARDLIARAGSYVEITPSGTGLRIIGKGNGAKVHRKQAVPGANGMTVEAYRNCERFISVTGDALPEATAELADNDALLDQVVAELDAVKAKQAKSKARQAKGKGGKGQRNKKLDLDDLIKNGEGGHFGGDRSRAVWFVINRLLEQGKSADEIVAVLIDPANGISAHCLDQSDPAQHARRQVERAQKERTQVLPPPSAPVMVARAFVESCWLHNGAADALTIRYWCGSWWMWRTTHWVDAQPHTVRSLLYGFTADAIYFDKEGNPAPWSPNRYKIGDLLEALSSLVILPDDFEQPCWIDGRQTGPIVATSNGLLDVASQQLLPHTPLYFGQVAVPFPYDPNAPAPAKWLDFLDELWPDEPDATDVLGEWFGYVISGRLDLHKIFVMVGPTRSGKGVIARIETALIGKRNVCGPTLNSFGSEFGLQPLLGKSLALISDARSGGGKNSSVVVERLLSISGEDTLTVNRKYREPMTGKLPVRLHIISNELPRLGDASSAIVGRLVLLLTTRSWLNKENYGLETELRTELTGILNWSLEGLRRLTLDNENHFTRFAAADEAITTMQDLASPVGAFVRERCKLGADDEIAVDDLYGAYKSWCELSEYPKSPKAHFGRDLRAACPSVRKRRPRDGSRRHFVYAGVRLRKKDEEGEE